MKILFVIDDVFEYVSGALYHGLKMLGHEVLDTTYMWFMYDDPNYNDEDYDKLYGRGFTLKKSLPYNLSTKNEDRSSETIIEKIHNHYFDLIIFSVYNHYKEYLKDVIKAKYQPNQVIFIDGNDWIDIDNLYVNALYFKRELYFTHPMQLRKKYRFIYPISYAIPSTKFWDNPDISIKHVKVIDNTCTIGYNYDNTKDDQIKYNTEVEYYNSYRQSYFANAVIKDGVNTMKIMEIISQYCLPYFEDFNTIPRSFLCTFPNDLQLEANELYWKMQLYGIANGYDTIFNMYKNILNRYYDYARKYMSSEYLAQYVLDKAFI